MNKKYSCFQNEIYHKEKEGIDWDLIWMAIGWVVGIVIIIGMIVIYTN